MNTRAVVANPGSVAEIVHMANALSGSQLLRAYFAPFAPTQSEIERNGTGWLGPVRRRWNEELRRRVVNEPIGRIDRIQVVRPHEVAAVAAVRLGMPASITQNLFARRNFAFESAVERLLQRHDTDLIIPSGAALLPLRRASGLGVRSWLDCPTVEHRYAAQLLTEEARLVPNYAASLQFVASTPDEARQIDEEVALADDLIVLSNFQRRTFAEAGVSPNRMHLLPLGVDTDLFHPTSHGPSAPFTIGFVGRVTQVKGVSYLISAFDPLRHDGMRLLMVGRPVGRGRHWLQEGVEHHLPVARWELPRFYSRMDVFVLPSLIEGFPMTALEAMASGIPVIVSENTFGRDVVIDGHNGFVVPIRDADAIVDRIRMLAHDESLRSTMGINARKTAEQYSWEAFGQRLINLITRP